MKMIFAILFLGANTGFSDPEMPPTGFCQTKTDYEATATCSSESVAVENQAALDSYLQNFGLSGGQYKNLKINFALAGGERVIHSPCRIVTAESLTHTASNICLDGREGVQISDNSVLTVQKLHILSPGGATLLGSSASVQGQGVGGLFRGG